MGYQNQRQPRRTPRYPSSRLHALLQYALQQLDPDCLHADWFKIGAAVYHATQGSADGFELYDDWSAQSLEGKYPGRRAMERRWEYYDKPLKRPITIGTLDYYLRQAGSSWSEVVAHVDKWFVDSDEEDGSCAS
jgi:hypothetical protein